MFNFRQKSRHLIMDEKDVTTVISAINKGHQYQFMSGNCGWALEPTKWFIIFKANDKQYGEVLKNLKKTGEFHIEVSPNSRQVDLYFERRETEL